MKINSLMESFIEKDAQGPHDLPYLLKRLERLTRQGLFLDRGILLLGCVPGEGLTRPDAQQDVDETGLEASFNQIHMEEIVPDAACLASLILSYKIYQTMAAYAPETVVCSIMSVSGCHVWSGDASISSVNGVCYRFHIKRAHQPPWFDDGNLKGVMQPVLLLDSLADAKGMLGRYIGPSMQALIRQRLPLPLYG